MYIKCSDSLHSLAQHWAQTQSDSLDSISPNKETRKMFLGEAISCFWNIDHGTLGKQTPLLMWFSISKSKKYKTSKKKNKKKVNFVAEK